MEEQKCHACGRTFNVAKDIDSLEAQEHCPYCKLWERILLGAAILATTIVLVFLVYYFKRHDFNLKVFFNISGLISDVWGGFLIATGFIERILSAMWFIDGSKHIDKYLPRQTHKIRVGLLLLLTGFTLQAISQLI